MNALLVSRSGRIKNCRWVQRRVIMYVRPGRTSRGIDTRVFGPAPPVVENQPRCGLRLQWELSRPSDSGGWIVQHITSEADMFDAGGNLIGHAEWNYWEAWKVDSDRLY